MIDARSLHNWLGNGKQFADWMKARITDYGFEEGADYFTEKCKTGGRPRTDYLLTLDTAEELAMVERTDIGRDTRRYFIQMEKAAERVDRRLGPTFGGRALWIYPRGWSPLRPALPITAHSWRERGLDTL